MPDKDQQLMFNKEELSLLKNTFADNDVLLYTIRKVLLQFPLTEVEKGLIKQTVNDAVYNVLKKRILPDISPMFPIGQLPSILNTLNDQLKVNNAREMDDHFRAKKLEIDYLKQQFAVLKDFDAPQPLKLAEMGVLTDDYETNFVNISAYLFILGYVDPQLNFIRSLAGAKDESPEDQKKRLTRDSSK